MNIIKVLERKAKTYPDKPAFIFRDDPITFSQLRDTVFKIAQGLLNYEELKFTKGDRIAIYLPNWPEYIYSYLAAWCCGATVVPLDYMLTEEELINCLVHSEAKVLIMKPKSNVILKNIKRQCQYLQEIFLCSDIVSDQRMEGHALLDDLIDRNTADVPAVITHEKEYAIIFYTSGTTGKPKGVLVNYLQLGVPPMAMEHFVDLNADDVTVCALPLSHLGGLIYIQNCLSFSLTVVLMERFVPTEFLKVIQQYKATCFWVVPSMYYAMLQLKEFEKFDLSSLRWMVTFGASSSPDALRRFQEYCPHAHFLNGWGLTETNAPTTVLPMGSKKIESVGRPAPWAEVKIVNDRNEELLCGEVGEIIVKGWMVTDGYYRDPEATAAAIKNGWFFTGDLGKFDEEGDLYIVGRKKEMIKVSGEIVLEPEVEAALQKHPDIAEAAVVAETDRLRGEVPKAFIVLKEGKTLGEEELRYFLRDHLAHFKIPHSFVFVSDLPKNRAGKIDKESLKQRPQHQ